MTSDRPYRGALDWDDALEEILAQSGRQFDPSIVELSPRASGTCVPSTRISGL
jgi:HD-GYP domain-containing protein (c-di-GMP phosphodiesterase class II)